MKLPTIHLHPSSSKYALIKRYEFLHYRSFWKVNKNTFWVKASYINMGDPIEMKPKGLFRGHPKISKKSKNTSLGLKLEEICLVKVNHFCEIAKGKMCSKIIFLSNGPSISWLYLVCDMVHDLNQHPYFICFIIYFILIFYYLKFKLNQINGKKYKRLNLIWFFCRNQIYSSWINQTKSSQGKLNQNWHDLEAFRKIWYKRKIKSNLQDSKRLNMFLLP